MSRYQGLALFVLAVFIVLFAVSQWCKRRPARRVVGVEPKDRLLPTAGATGPAHQMQMVPMQTQMMVAPAAAPATQMLYVQEMPAVQQQMPIMQFAASSSSMNVHGGQAIHVGHDQLMVIPMNSSFWPPREQFIQSVQNANVKPHGQEPMVMLDATGNPMIDPESGEPLLGFPLVDAQTGVFMRTASGELMFQPVIRSESMERLKQRAMSSQNQNQNQNSNQYQAQSKSYGPLLQPARHEPYARTSVMSQGYTPRAPTLDELNYRYGHSASAAGFQSLSNYNARVKSNPYDASRKQSVVTTTEQQPNYYASNYAGRPVLPPPPMPSESVIAPPSQLMYNNDAVSHIDSTTQYQYGPSNEQLNLGVSDVEHRFNPATGESVGTAYLPRRVSFAVKDQAGNNYEGDGSMNGSDNNLNRANTMPRDSYLTQVSRWTSVSATLNQRPKQ